MIYGNKLNNFNLFYYILYRFSRSIQRFPQIDENFSNNFCSYPSTDFISNDKTVTNQRSVQQPTKRYIPININRSRSCSGGRNKAMSPPALMRKGILYNTKKKQTIKPYFFLL